MKQILIVLSALLITGCYDIIGSNNVKYENANDYSAHDALLCIAQKLTINQTNRKVSNSEIYFKSSDQMINIFADIPEKKLI